MDRRKNQSLTDPRTYFAGELRTVLAKHRVSTDPNAFEYLVALLIRSIESHHVFLTKAEGQYENPLLAELYAGYLNSNAEQRKTILQKIGDISLMISGFFGASLNRGAVDVGYYFGMGGVAYATLAQMYGPESSRKAVYSELSVKFQPFSNVFEEMSVRSGLQSNKDLLRLYERWLITGSARLKELLRENGIQPVSTERGPKH